MWLGSAPGEAFRTWEVFSRVFQFHLLSGKYSIHIPVFVLVFWSLLIRQAYLKIPEPFARLWSIYGVLTSLGSARTAPVFVSGLCREHFDLLLFRFLLPHL